MKIFFFGGTFDPPHKAHKLMYKYCLGLCDKFIFFPCKQSPLKSEPFSSNVDRMKMLELLIDNKDFKKVSIDDFELNNGDISFTIDTINYIKNKFPSDSIYMVIGYDQYKNFKKWKKYKEILNNVEIVCFMRSGNSFDANFDATFIDFDYEISSTLIRKSLKVKDYESIKPLLDQKVYDYIVKKGIYRN